jgi:tRNA threonylcarbamoyladenosine biosynthesis protein TsaE
MCQLIVNIRSEQELRQFGELLARSLPAATVVALRGTLGAGKTRLVQAVAAGLGVDPKVVTSPTFVLCQHYRGRLTIHHLDAYRVRDPDEFLELGADEYLDGPDITFIEWADRVSACLPEDYLDVMLEVVGPQARRLILNAHGPRSRETLDRLREAVER